MCSEEVTLKYNGSWPGILIRDGVRHSMLGLKTLINLGSDKRHIPMLYYAGIDSGQVKAIRARDERP